MRLRTSIVRPILQTESGRLPRSSRILIYEIHTGETSVTEYDGVRRHQPVNSNPADRRRAIREKVAVDLYTIIVRGLQNLGFAVEQAARGNPAVDKDIVIDVRLVSIDQGDPLRRLLVGFGSGAARLETAVWDYQGRDQRKLLEFFSLADSGKLPGIACTLPVGAAAQGGLSASLFPTNAIGSGFTAYRTGIRQMAAPSGDQTVRYLSEFFASQG